MIAGRVLRSWICAWLWECVGEDGVKAEWMGDGRIGRERGMVVEEISRVGRLEKHRGGAW